MSAFAAVDSTNMVVSAKRGASSATRAGQMPSVKPAAMRRRAAVPLVVARMATIRSP